jgi:hypothetical protein
MNNLNVIRICQVIDTYDESDGDRIKVRIKRDDDKFTDEELPYAFPLLPKMIHVKPKIGEWVLLLTSKASPNSYNSNRYYIGPIISQPQYLEGEMSEFTVLSQYPGALKEPDVAPSTNTESHGAFAKDKDVAIYGRKKNDIILSDNDINIRNGSRLKDNAQKGGIVFNRSNPSFINLKHHDNNRFIGGTTADTQTNEEVSTDNAYKSSVVVAADKIALLSHQSKLYASKIDKDTMISDEEVDKLIEKAQSLPYGDILVDFLKQFLNAFLLHVHPYPGMSPDLDDRVGKLYSYDLQKILNKNVKMV